MGIVNTVRSYSIIIEYLLHNQGVNKVTTKMIKDKLSNHGIERDSATIIQDFNNISDIFLISITKKGNRQSGWQIDISNNPNFERIFQTYYSSLINNEITETISNNKELGKHIIFDFLNNVGLRNIPAILRAINSNKQIIVEYKKDNEILSNEYLLNPFLLKSYLNRWYLVAFDVNNKLRKVFSLDRIEAVKNQSETFVMPNLVKIIKEFTNNIGVRYYKNNAEKVIIRFYKNQHKYFLSEPWLPEGLFEVNDVFDSEGKIINEQKDISFTTNLNNELHQRILFNNVKCKVLEPQSLVDRIKEILTDTLKLYK